MRARAFAAALLLASCTPQADPPPPGASAAGNPAVLNVADAAISGGDPAMALKISQSVLAADPHDLQALYHEAAAYYAVDRCEDAIAAYKLALGQDPRSSDAETGIGRCLLKRNAIEAEQAFAAAVADDPGNAAAQNDLGIARDLRGNFAGATLPYQQALLLDPGNVATEVNLGLSLALSGDPDDALEYLGPLANGAQATPKIREDYATALLAAGRNADARQVLAVDLPPSQLDADMTTLAGLITQPATVPDPPAAAPAPAPIAAITTAPPTGATLPPATATLALASNDPPPPPAAAAPPLLPQQTASLPLADTGTLSPSPPTAPSAILTLAPAISPPMVTAPAPSLTASARAH
jgi:Flp pilus assembly protein TadD